MKKENTAILFDYDAKGKTQAERVNITRKLYGYTDYSQHGRYKYDRAGLLTSIPHLNPTQSCIIVRKGDAKKIEDFFRQNGIQFDRRTVLLNGGEKLE